MHICLSIHILLSVCLSIYLSIEKNSSIYLPIYRYINIYIHICIHTHAHIALLQAEADAMALELEQKEEPGAPLAEAAQPHAMEADTTDVQSAFQAPHVLFTKPLEVFNIMMADMVACCFQMKIIWSARTVCY